MLGETKIPRDAAILVAVSGGPDSMALLHVLARLGEELGVRVLAHGVDHGLRPEARAELDLAEALARSVSVPFARTTVQVEAGGNLQARARTVRFAALAAAARSAGANTIATAHHADDRAETVLLRLLRGAGPRGLGVLPPRAPLVLGAGALGAGELAAGALGTGALAAGTPDAGDDDEPAPEGDATSRAHTLELVRPLLRARREDVLSHVARHALRCAADPSNADPRFLRTRVRAELLPLLTDLSPAVVDHLVALADQLTHATRETRAMPEDAETMAFPLPRATQTALAALARSRSPRGRVWLPQGLVASVPPSPSSPTEPRAPRSARPRPKG